MGFMATRMSDVRLLACLFLCTGFLAHVLAFDSTAKDNLAIYWGQDGANSQQRLSFYCQDDTVDVIPLAFLYIFRGTGGEPVIDFANTCSNSGDPVFAGTELANCTAAMASDIQFCQSQGKIITLSLGGGTGQVGFSSDSQAQSFATQIWNLFLGGTSSIRPFGSVVLDGLDLDIESGTPDHYAAFVTQIRTLAAPTGKTYYITAAPQCPYPDANIGAALNEASFDAVYVQFYNNYCGLDQPSEYNFATWDNWAKTTSFNKNVKVYIGAPGSAQAAGTGYVSSSTLANYVSQAQSNFSSFGGVMMWDMDSAYSNNRFDKAVKSAMVASAAKLGPPAAQEPSPTSANAPTQKPAPSSQKGVSSASAKPVSSASAAPSPKAISSASATPSVKSVSSASATHSLEPATSASATLSVKPVSVSSASAPHSVKVTSSASVTPTVKLVSSASAPSLVIVSSISATHSAETSLISTASVQPTLVPSTTASKVGHHRFRPHETINPAASERLEKWESEAASFFRDFTPHETARPHHAEFEHGWWRGERV